MLDSIIKIAEIIFKFLSDGFKKWDKTTIIAIVMSIASCVIITLATSVFTIKTVDGALGDFRTTLNQDMLCTLEKYETSKDSIRKQSELEVINRQSIIKSKLRGWLGKTGADYILVAQFHNNVQSIAGCQFVKFDVTYNIYNKNLPHIELDDFQNVNITKYDIIPYVWDHNFTQLSVKELEAIDELLYTQIRKYAPNVKNLAIHHLNIGGNSDGVIIYMFKDKCPDFSVISDCTTEIGRLIYN